MPKLSSIALDPQKSDEGEWFEYTPGMRFRIARLGNPRFQQEVERLLQPYARGGAAARLSAEQRLERVTVPAMSKFVLLDWEGVEDENGQPIPYSHEAAREILADPKYRAFADWVTRTAGSDDLYLAQAVEDAAGN